MNVAAIFNENFPGGACGALIVLTTVCLIPNFVILLINGLQRKWDFDREYPYRIFAFIASAILLMFLFSALPITFGHSAPRVKIAKFNSTAGAPTAPVSGTPAAAQFLLDEHKKGTDEIKMRIDHGDAWFYRKFIMVGGLLAAFVAALGSKALEKCFPDAGPDPLEIRYEYLIRSNATCTVLALAMAVAVSIDIHTRISDSAVHQIALWITHYVEPAFFGAQKIGYETHLRELGGQHQNPLMTFVLRPYGYFLTWAVYLLYLTCLYKVCCRAGRKAVSTMETPFPASQQRLALAGFLLVHFCLGAFAVVAHSAPPAYNLHVFFDVSTPDNKWTFPGDVCGWLFLIPFAGLTALHLPPLARLVTGSWRSGETNQLLILCSSNDKHFAQRLNGRIRDEGFDVQYAPDDSKIETTIRAYDKLLIALSETSLQSEWVMTELRKARQAEHPGSKRKLFPVRLVDMETLRDWECFDADGGKDLAVELREYFIPDFSHWKEHDRFEASFARLLKDLRADEKAK